MQCIASNVFCPEESSQASQMHLVRSHDNSPDLFADNDGGYDVFWVGFTADDADMGTSLDWFFENGTEVFWRNFMFPAQNIFF